MQIHYDLNQFEALNPVVTIGTFDGVHLGHREVISELKRISQISSGNSVVFTFEPHPRIVIAPNEDSLRLLSTTAEKIRLIRNLGIDHLVIYPFTIDFSKLTYSEFVTDILVKKMNISALVVGYDHRFGQGRKGDFSSLEALSGIMNFKVEQLSQLLVDNKIVSSSKIRLALEAGDVENANQLLGYRYPLSGKVIEGKRLGHKLGFPTANIEAFDCYKMVPADGVYAVLVEIGGKVHKGMLNIGIRPTVNYNADHKSIEVHILDFEENIYGKDLTMFFVKKIREEQNFGNVGELLEQLKKDRVVVFDILSNESVL